MPKRWIWTAGALNGARFRDGMNCRAWLSFREPR